MEQTASLTVSWQAVSAIGGVLVLVVGVATGFLRLSMQNALNVMEKNIRREIEEKFTQKAVIDLEFREIRDRVARLEGVTFPIKS